MVLVVKNLPAKAGDIETRVPSLGWKDPLEEGRIPRLSEAPWQVP